MSSFKYCVAFAVFILLLSPCCSRSALEDEETVVSIYTTTPATANSSKPLDVYQQIATNIAQRITSPIYKFLGISGNKTTNKPKTTGSLWSKIELDDIDDVTVPHQDPDNDISKARDVEELSPDASPKPDKKPEKITLYSNYLPARLAVNETDNEIDSDSFEFDDVESVDEDEGKAADGGFVWFLEMIGSVVQLLWGGFTSWLKPSGRGGDV